MFVSEEEAAAMYARWCRSWYGARARSVVNSKIRTPMARGDRKGVEAWQQVARALESQKAEALATGSVQRETEAAMIPLACAAVGGGPVGSGGPLV